MAAAKTYKYGFKIDGDPSSGVRALKVTQSEIEALDKKQKKLISTNKRLAKRNRELANSFGSVKKVAGGLVGVLSLGLLAGQFKDVAVETDSFKGSLVTMTGSIENSELAFQKLLGFAAKTPFTLDQSVQGFIKLTALGLTPSEKAMLSYGNTAAAMGKDLNQMIEAVADASTMEFERDRKSTRLNSSHPQLSRMPSSA